MNNRLILIIFIFAFFSSSKLFSQDTIIEKWANGNPKTVTYTVKDKLKVADYYENGNIEKITFYFSSYNKGPLKDSVLIAYYENGKKKAEIACKLGQKNGLAKEWYENGQLKSKGMYINDKEEGLWEYWYDNGKKKISIETKNGKNEGKFIKWDEKGNLIEERLFQDGQEVPR